MPVLEFTKAMPFGGIDMDVGDCADATEHEAKVLLAICRAVLVPPELIGTRTLKNVMGGKVVSPARGKALPVKPVHAIAAENVAAAEVQQQAHTEAVTRAMEVDDAPVRFEVQPQPPAPTESEPARPTRAERKKRKRRDMRASQGAGYETK